MLNSIYTFYETKLTTQQRRDLPEDAFALPNRRYPIHDEKHARLALAMVARFGKPGEKKKVQAAVHKRYPNIGK
jgi:hypothetical protein